MCVRHLLHESILSGSKYLNTKKWLVLEVLFFKTKPLFFWTYLSDLNLQPLDFAIALRMTLPVSADVALTFESPQEVAVWCNWHYPSVCNPRITQALSSAELPVWCLAQELAFVLNPYSEINHGAGAAQVKVPQKRQLFFTVVTGEIVLPPTKWTV